MPEMGAGGERRGPRGECFPAACGQARDGVATWRIEWIDDVDEKDRRLGTWCDVFRPRHALRSTQIIRNMLTKWAATARQ